MNTESVRKENVARINNAILYIETHLSEKLILSDIAKEAYFSPFHFHRIFSLVVGETVNNFIARLRIEKAANFLIHQKEISITEVSEIIGFTSLSSFSRAFKKFYGISPAEFKELSPEKYSKICKTESKNGQVVVSFEQYICNVNNALNWIKMNGKTTIQNVEELQLAYISHKGEMEKVGKVFNRLIQWAAPKGLMNQENLRLLTIYHDSPKITSPENIRSSIAIVLNTETTVEGEVRLKTIQPGKCIVSRFEITPNEFQQAWESNFVWMSENGYKKGDKDPFEIYYNNAAEHPENKFIVDMCIPVL
ncbi:AraC family transcriptional regulator [Polaribacter gochangensis]|uniref:AraC family transcriptional regulator n=1 Tax=Polaribacter gochangensis TaxID=3252903 RepID=UPI003904B1B4